MSSKFIGAGLATISLIGPGCGLGILFNAFITGISRNPSLKGELFISSLISFALIEECAKRLYKLQTITMIFELIGVLLYGL